MTRREQLERLDDQVVPVVAAALRRLLDRARELDRRGRFPQRRSLLGGGGGRRGRFTGPRAVPELGLLLVATVVFVAASLIAVTHQPASPDGTAEPGPLPVGVALMTGIGPTIGQLAETYVSDVRRQTQRSTSRAPDSIQLGLVTLTGFLTPAQVVSLVGPLTVERVLLQAQVTAGTAAVVDSPVTQVVPDLTALFARNAARRQGDARDLKTTGDSITPKTQEQADFKAFYRTALATAEQEIVAYQQGCPCVFMVLVRGRASALQALEANPQVRAVEFAPTGLTTGQFVVTPLLPGTTGQVKILARTNATGV